MGLQDFIDGMEKSVKSYLSELEQIATDAKAIEDDSVEVDFVFD
jgi:hypothetical protein